MENTGRFLIDPNRIDDYSTRSLMYLCEKNRIKLPFHPKREQIVESLKKQLLVEKEREIAMKNVRVSDNFNESRFCTPILQKTTSNSKESTITPVICSKYSEDRVYNSIPQKNVVSPVISALMQTMKPETDNNGNNPRFFRISVLMSVLCLIVFVLIYIFFDLV